VLLSPSGRQCYFAVRLTALLRRLADSVTSPSGRQRYGANLKNVSRQTIFFIKKFDS